MAVSTLKIMQDMLNNVKEDDFDYPARGWDIRLGNQPIAIGMFKSDGPGRFRPREKAVVPDGFTAVNMDFAPLSSVVTTSHETRLEPSSVKRVFTMLTRMGQQMWAQDAEAQIPMQDLVEASVVGIMMRIHVLTNVTPTKIITWRDLAIALLGVVGYTTELDKFNGVKSSFMFDGVEFAEAEYVVLPPVDHTAVLNSQNVAVA